MGRVYKCPICGKSYSSLVEMYKCAQECEDKENARAIDEAAMQKRFEDEAEIREAYQNLKTKIEKFNRTYGNCSFSISMDYGSKNVTAPRAAAPAQKIGASRLEKFLSDFIKDEDEKENVSEDSTDKIDDTALTEGLIDLVNSIFGTDITLEEYNDFKAKNGL
jgi:DNA repair exonuclease SbcCD ATPase subunit